MQLKEPDATWPFRLTTTQAAIVPSDSDTYPADELAANGEVVGSGPYEMEEYEDGQTARLVPFEDYGGPAEVKNGGAIMTYFPQESALALAVENGDVDVAYRSLSPTTVEDLSSTDGRGGRRGRRQPRSATSSSTPASRRARTRPPGRPWPRSSTARRSPRTSTTTP